jgi:hypothetical protein
MNIKTTFERKTTTNVIGYLKGSKYPDEYIVIG